MKQGPAQKEGGIFMFGMSNNVIGNHVVGHDNGLWSQGSSQGNGRPHGTSFGRICPQFVPFGRIQGNVYHDCARFGTYVDFQYPRNVEQNSDGFTNEKAGAPQPSCDPFTRKYSRRLILIDTIFTIYNYTNANPFSHKYTILIFQLMEMIMGKEFLLKTSLIGTTYL